MPRPLFDTWTTEYDQWFTTPAGRLIKQYETRLLLELLDISAHDTLLDVGCGTGIFTRDMLESGPRVTGIDLSKPMLEIAVKRLADFSFTGIVADMTRLPFADNSFAKTVSMTAIEFVTDAALAIREIKRVTCPGGTIVVTTLNSLSPWAKRRRQMAAEGHRLFRHIHFRTPDEIRELAGPLCTIRTAIHFDKNTPVEDIPRLEKEKAERNVETGAFLAARWFNNKDTDPSDHD